MSNTQSDLQVERILMKELKPTDGFILQGWMRATLGLKGGELIAFALVHQFSQSSVGIYKGGVNYLASWLGCSYNTSRSYLKALVEKGLIKEMSGKNEGVPYCYYTSNFDGDMQNLPYPPAKIDDRNIKGYINNNTLSNKEKAVRFQKPSIEEIEQYCYERNNSVDAETFFNFYEAKGWMVGKSPMKDWRAAVRTWEKRPVKAQTSAPYKKESVYEHNMRVMKELLGK